MIIDNKKEELQVEQLIKIWKKKYLKKKNLIHLKYYKIKMIDRLR